MNLEDLTNKQFGNLKVLYRAKDYISPKGKKHTMWHCKCLNCGKELDIRKSSLQGKIGNRSRSCGCIKTELTNEFNRKCNKYNLENDYGIGWTTNSNKEFYFDLKDYDLIKDYCWLEDGSGYIQNSKHKKMHQIIMNDKYIDHKDRNKKNNRRSNLRKYNFNENSMNRNKQKNNTSGHKGVMIFKNKYWMARVKKNGKSYCKYFSINKYGYEKAYNLACQAQENLDLELFKEFSIYYKGV